MRLDGSIDSWLPADTMKLKRRVGAMLGVQNVENMVVKARAGSIVVTLTILEGAYPCPVQLSAHGWRKMGLLLQCKLWVWKRLRRWLIPEAHRCGRPCGAPCAACTKLALLVRALLTCFASGMQRWTQPL